MASKESKAQGLPGLPPPAPGKAKKEKKSWSGTWIDSESTKKDEDGGTVTIAKVKTNVTDEVDNLFNLALGSPPSRSSRWTEARRSTRRSNPTP